MELEGNTFTASELEFLAEATEVTINPNFSMDLLHFIQGEFGPFRPSLPATVPLWLAVLLKKRQKCKIQPPFWLELGMEYLTSKKTAEIEKPGEFTEMPSFFMEISAILLECASDDIPNAQALRTTLQDLWDVRFAKARNGLHQIDDGTLYVQLNNMSMMELNTIRPFFSKTMDQFYALRTAKAELEAKDI